jgi:hypothetical protein
LKERFHNIFQLFYMNLFQFHDPNRRFNKLTCVD